MRDLSVDDIDTDADFVFGKITGLVEGLDVSSPMNYIIVIRSLESIISELRRSWREAGIAIPSLLLLRNHEVLHVFED